MTYRIQVPGKWILAGEHSVLRGAPALVFPLKSRLLELSYETQEGPLGVQFSGEHGKELQLLVWGVLERACELKKISLNQLTGQLHLQSSIPVGAGMGASAALCVAVTRWMQHLGFVSEEEMFEFARTLENLFHGESSGVDIAVSLSNEGLHYERGGERRSLRLQWQPQWFISYCGQRGVTLECVQKVKNLIVQNPTWGEGLDRKMKEASLRCEEALQFAAAEKGFAALCAGIDSAREVFEEWGLTEGLPARHMQELLAAGASAVKPTGSGGGGYVLSLWKEAPPARLRDLLIPC